MSIQNVFTPTANSPSRHSSLVLRIQYHQHSSSAARQAQHAALKKRGADAWRESPRYRKMREIDEKLPGGSFLKLTSKFPRRNTSILMQLRTGHAPLNYFLHKIGKADSPMCPECNMESEDVSHYLIRCPRYDEHRLKMQQHYRRHIIPKKTLLAAPGAMKLLFEFANKTRRFEKPYGTFEEPKVKETRKARRAGAGRERQRNNP